MAGLSMEQKAEVEAMIVAALRKQEDEISAKLNLIIAQAESNRSELQSGMDRSKELHEAEVRARWTQGPGEAICSGSRTR